MSVNDDILFKIDSEIGKDKKVVELKKEIDRLNQEIIGLNNCIIEFHSEFCNKQAEINRLNNIINGMEKFFQYAYDNESRELNDKKVSVWIICLEKLQELKGDK